MTIRLNAARCRGALVRYWHLADNRTAFAFVRYWSAAVYVDRILKGEKPAD
jgi:hypothetical protein